MFICNFLVASVPNGCALTQAQNFVKPEFTRFDICSILLAKILLILQIYKSTNCKFHDHIMTSSMEKRSLPLPGKARSQITEPSSFHEWTAALAQTTDLFKQDKFKETVERCEKLLARAEITVGSQLSVSSHS